MIIFLTIMFMHDCIILYGLFLFGLFGLFGTCITMVCSGLFGLYMSMNVH